MELAVRHHTTYRYETPALEVALLLRLQPQQLDTQTLRAWEVTVNGAPVQAFRPNAFGDGEAYCLQRAVGEIVIVASGIVETRDQGGIISGFQQDVPLPVFLRQTPLTQPDAIVLALAQQLMDLDTLSRLHALSALVRGKVSYSPGATSTTSTATEALTQGRGVCQDHAHIFVSAARVLGIPARYVVGYLLAEAGDLALQETHAWAEAWVEGLGWIGFDATNGLCATDRYVRLCCGLDAHDAAPVRGSVIGATTISIQAEVLIGEAEPNVPQQMQQQQ